MHDHKVRQFSKHTDRMPSVLTIRYAVRNDNMQRVVPNAPGELE
jgi:hypothetical protein